MSDLTLEEKSRYAAHRAAEVEAEKHFFSRIALSDFLSATAIPAIGTLWLNKLRGRHLRGGTPIPRE